MYWLFLSPRYCAEIRLSDFGGASYVRLANHINVRCSQHASLFRLTERNACFVMPVQLAALDRTNLVYCWK